jgi:5-bromo-4-chloroindolyl phosphate hydrolysis protein
MKKYQEFINENFNDEARAYLDYIFKNLKKEPADDYPEERFFYKIDNKVYFEYDIPSKNIWPIDEIYDNLKKAFYLVDSEIRDLLKEYCKKYLDVEVRIY